MTDVELPFECGAVLSDVSLSEPTEVELMDPAANSSDVQFALEERPKFPGSPFTPTHPRGRRVAYAAVGVVTGICTTFCNALVNVNVSTISGSLGLFAAEASWLPAIYVAMNASANLTLVKARVQFGIPAVTLGLLTVYVMADLLQLAIPVFASAVLVRAVDGMTAAALVTLTTYYLREALPRKLGPLALVVSIGLAQLGTPFARLLPVDLLAMDHWRGLHLIELGVALGLVATIWTFPLPPNERKQSFEALDILTITLVVPAMLLVCSVLGEGRLLWWTDTTWLGWSLACAVPLFAAAALVETLRARPMLQLEWLGSTDLLRFAAVALVVRLALAEQTYGSVGLLTSGGLTNDQLHLLFAFVAIAMVMGILTAALTLSEHRLPWQIMIAALIIALGAWIDSGATNLTRPPQLYLSQALIGFGTTLFVGPALVYGMLRVLNRGPDFYISFVVLFSTTQNVGGLLGSTILGTYQVIQTRAHESALSEHLLAANPEVVSRIQYGATALADAVTDSSQRTALGANFLAQAMAREATVLAFNDVFRLVAVLALATAIFIAYFIAITAARRRKLVPMDSPT